MQNGGRPTEGLRYSRLADGTCAVRGIGSAAGREIVIPATHEGARVSAIADYAFLDCDTLERAVLPEGLTRIGEYAFSDCTALREIVIPSTLEHLGAGAFDNCTSLESLTLPAPLVSELLRAAYGTGSLPRTAAPQTDGEAWEEDDDDAASKFAAGPTEGLEYKVLDGGSCAVSGIGSARDRLIVIPSEHEGRTVTSIADDAFRGCDTLTGVILSPGVTSIGRRAFFNCSALVSLTLPTTLSEIGSDTFLGCTSLSSIELPEGLVCIGEDAFRKCSALAEISLPASLASIGEGAFYACSALSSVRYAGGSRGWSRVSVGRGNDALVARVRG